MIPAGSMSDAGQATSPGVAYRLERSGTGVVPRMSMDPGWLLDSARRHSVLVMPAGIGTGSQ